MSDSTSPASTGSSSKASPGDLAREVANLRGRLARAEAAQKASEARYTLLQRATNDVIRDWDLTTNTITWNDAVVTHFGYTQEELGTGLEGWVKHIHPDDRDRVIAGVRA